MTPGLLFAVIAVVAIVFGFLGRKDPNYPLYGAGINFILILILGWQVFGPLVHR